MTACLFLLLAPLRKCPWKAVSNTYIWNITFIHIHSYASIYIHMYTLLMKIHDVIATYFNINKILENAERLDTILKQLRRIQSAVSTSIKLFASQSRHDS